MERPYERLHRPQDRRIRRCQRTEEKGGVFFDEVEQHPNTMKVGRQPPEEGCVPPRKRDGDPLEGRSEGCTELVPDVCCMFSLSAEHDSMLRVGRSDDPEKSSVERHMLMPAGNRFAHEERGWPTVPAPAVLRRLHSQRSIRESTDVMMPSNTSGEYRSSKTRRAESTRPS